MANNGEFCELGDVPTGSMKYGNVPAGYLRHCVTIRKVVVSNPDGVIGIFI